MATWACDMSGRKLRSRTFSRTSVSVPVRIFTSNTELPDANLSPSLFTIQYNARSATLTPMKNGAKTTLTLV